MRNLKKFIDTEIKSGKTILPKDTLIFNAFKLTPFETVKVVIIGQDPYHTKGVANGLSFSITNRYPLPPSLKNIFKELSWDLSLVQPISGNLTNWALQGVLLLNTCLTVEENRPRSHRKKGWELFTDEVVRLISQKKENIVFILWGEDAKAKKTTINENQHLVLESSHPSPFSCYKGFFGSRPFSKTNQYLISNGLTPINWIASNPNN